MRPCFDPCRIERLIPGTRCLTIHLFIILMFFVGSQSNSGTLIADDLESLLKRLDLKGLQATFVENELANTIDPDEQKKLRETLARLYVADLKTLIEKPEQFKAITQRLEELESKVPELNDPEVVFTRLETRFRHGEYLLSVYRDDRRKIKLLSEISNLFEQLAERFQELGTACEKRIESLEGFDFLANSLEMSQADQKIDKLVGISFRSSFYVGWSAFHCGMSKQNSKLGRPFFVKALGAFCTFLDLDSAEDVASWDVELLELSLTRNCQAFLGIALTYLALGQNADSDHCFEILRGKESAESIRKQLAFWQIQTLLELGKLDDALELATAYLSSPDLLNALQKGQISLLLVRFGYANAKPGEKETQIGFLGIKTLTQLRQFDLVQRQIEEYSIILPRPSFYSDWIAGQGLYEQAEKTGLPADYLKAASALKLAITMGKGNPVGDVERCRYQLGWAYYKGGEFQLAAGSLGLVIEPIARLEPGTAATALWLQHDCYVKLSAEDPDYTKKALASLNRLVNRFPESDLNKRARLQIVKLEQTSMKAEDTVDKLKEAAKNTPDDLPTQYELCLATYRRFLEVAKKEGDTSKVAAEATTLAKKLGGSDKLSAAQKLKLVLVQLDIQIRTDIKNVSQVDGLVEQADALAAEVKIQPLLAEWRYRKVQVARDRNDLETLNQNVEWLVENGDGTVYQRSVLVTRIQQLENELKGVPKGAKRSQLLEQAIDVYSKLAQASGYHLNGIKTNNNAKVAVSRLATFYEEKGELDEAKKNFELLVEAFPKKVSYLTGYARVLTRLGEYSNAADQWRVLGKGLKKESDDWYRAKYNLFKCLAETDSGQAAPPLKQFLGLYDPPPSWKPRFSELANQIGLE